MISQKGIDMKKTGAVGIKGTIVWHVFQSEHGNWIGICDTLGLTMEGPTIDELNLNIQDAVNSIFNQLLKKGELENFFNDRGWGSQQYAMEKDTETSVPIDLLVHSNYAYSTSAVH